jgi:site-specific DNA-methyltransferase (adenine-specific)
MEAPSRVDIAPAEKEQTETKIITNHLYYGDNLDILRKHIKDESIDLIYLDPPFNSQATYNVLFRSPAGQQSKAQIEAFEDTWHWTDEAEKAFDEVMTSGNTDAAEMLRAMRSFLKENDMMAYLTMMADRLIELHRVLKPKGSLYLHCDPTASHYLKIILDGIFGATNFRNEISWRRSQPKSHTTVNFPNCRDIILRYSKSEEVKFNKVYGEHDPEYLENFYRYVDADGRRYRLGDLTNPNKDRPNLTYEFLGVTRVWRWTKDRMQKAYEAGRIYQSKPGTVPQFKRYLNDMLGQPISDDWDDIEHLHGSSGETLGYPTQKPLSLLERIIQSSSNEGDIILDPFCGCGTTIHAAQKLRRHWIGIDITHLAISLIEKRLNDAFPGITYQVHGTPKDVDGAKALADDNKYQFQWWAVSLVNAVPYGGKKKGADTGIDGHIYFKPDGKTTELAIVSVKGGEHVSVPMIRDLGHVVDREKAKIGLFITLAEPTKPMQTEALKAGFYETPYGKFPKLQILTIRELFEGKQPQLPWRDPSTFKKARQENTAQQEKLF